METARNGEPDARHMDHMVNPNEAGLMMLQRQLMELQSQYVESQKCQHWLMTQVHQLKEENTRLQMENQFLSLVPGSNEEQSDYQLLIVDGLDNMNADFDEGLVHEIVQDVFAECLPQNGRRL